VDIDGDQDLVHRLAEMGVCPGAELQMVRPGSPCIIALDNRRVSFRGDNAAAILVETVARTAAGRVPTTAAKELSPAKRTGLGRWLGAS
jgi:Fe2+ transport system protein FeoA